MIGARYSLFEALDLPDFRETYSRVLRNSVGSCFGWKVYG